MKIKFLIISTFILSTSCVTYEMGNKKISNRELTSRIERNITTQSDIVNWFDNPESKGFEDGKEKWSYSYSRQKANFTPIVGFFVDQNPRKYSIDLSFDPETKIVREFNVSNPSDD